MHTRQTKKSDDYQNKRAVYSILILDFCHSKLTGSEYLHNHIIENKENGDKFFETMGFFLIELPNVPKNGDGTLLCDLLRLIQCTTREELEQIVKENPEMKEIADRIVKFTDDEIKALNAARRANYEAEARALRQQLLEEGEQIGIAKGEARGEARGIAKANLILARKALRQGYSLKAISDLTGFSMAKLKRLAAKIKLQIPPES